MKNNNQNIIKKLVFRQLKSNKKRVLITLIAIMLSCLLITSVMTVSMNMLHAMQETVALRAGSNAALAFKKVQPSIANRLVTHPLMVDYGVSTIVGRVDDDKLSRRLTEVRTMDETYMEKTFSNLIEGRLPQKITEITIDGILAELLGADLNDNNHISLSILINEKLVTRHFDIVGITNSNTLSHASYLLVSESFKNTHCTDTMASDYSGGKDILVDFHNGEALADNFMTIIEDLGISYEQANPSVNPAFSFEALSLSPATIIAYLVFIVLLMTSSYLIISNIYRISTARDIKKYGLLKAVGTTSKQLKQMIYLEVIILFLLALPLGLLAGYGFGVIILPLVLKPLNVSFSAIETSPWIFILASIIALTTLLISCRKPASFISKVAPIEATKDPTYHYYRRSKKRRNGNGLRHMAFKGVFRQRRQTAFVILSLTLSLIILCATVVRVTEFDEKQFVDTMIGSDYLIATSDYFQIDYPGTLLNEEIMRDIKGDLHPLYREVDFVYLSRQQHDRFMKLITEKNEYSIGQNEIRKGLVEIERYTIDNFQLKVLSDYLISGKIPKALDDDEIIIEENYFIDESRGTQLIVGDVIKCKNQEYRIIAIVKDLPSYMHDKSFRENSIHAYVNTPSNQIMSLMVDGRLDKELLEQSYPGITIKSRDDYIEETKEFTTMLQVVGYSLSFLLGLIGLMNFINMSVTSILTRQREFAILESIGMTGKQISKQLILEGFYVIAISALLSLVSSIGLSILMVSYFSMSFILPLCIIVGLLMLLSMFIPIQAKRSLNKDSLVTRITYKE